MSTAQTPYVGMRPYEREERERFFGRGDDARRLADKIFAAPITLFCALSGVGKSSVLRALVIPELEAEACHVVYFESWSGTAPLCDLTRAVADSAGISVADGALVQAAEKAVEATGKTVVLVLDQFEEFLVRHGLELAPMSKALGALCRRQEIDIHIVLSLREEFLAALEPFRDDIPMLFRSTFRLQQLDDERARQAIEQPAVLPGFDKHYEPALVDALMADLHGYVPGHGHALASADTIELPFLQLVCSELWAAAADRGLDEMTLAMYVGLGRLSGIMERYVRRVMAELSDSERTEIAHILDFLAPESHLKSTYSMAELHRHCKVPEEHIERYLNLLGRHRIVRTRPVGATELYELYHDAFIPMLRPWSEELLKQEERRHEQQEHQREERARQRKVRVRLLIAASFAALCIAAVLYTLWSNQKAREKTIAARQALEYRENVTDKLARLPDMDRDPKKRERTLDEVTAYLLQESHGRRDLARIRTLLKEQERYLPDSYGTDEMLSYVLPAAPSELSWPITIRLSPDRRVNGERLRLYWWLYATSYVTKWGTPMPVRVVIERDATLPVHTIEIAVRDHNGTNPDVRRYRIDDHDNALLVHDDLPWHLKSFLDVLKRNNEVVRHDDFAAGWLLVPRWTYPVWKVSGRDARPAESWLADVILERLFDDDVALVLTRRAVDYVLTRLDGEGYKASVAAACAARGATLRDDLLAVLKTGTPLHELPRILETLAELPGLSSDEVAQAARLRVQDLDAVLPGTLPDTSTAAQCPGLADPGSEQRRQLELVYQDNDSWLQLAPPPIRVTMGNHVVDEIAGDGTLHPIIQEAVSALRSQVFRDWGVQLPGVSFRSDEELAPDMVRIDVLSLRDDQGIFIATQPGQAAQQIAAELHTIAVRHRTHWLTHEWVARQLATSSQPLREWLDTRYSLAGQRVLLRAVLDQGRSIRHLDWLLASLPFWTQVDDARSTRAMAARLGQTQLARLASPRTGSTAGEARLETELRKGIDALARGATRQAEKSFARALSMNQSVAVEAFPRLYAEHFHTRDMKRVMKACGPPDPKAIKTPTLDSLPARLAEDIAELMDSRGSELDPAALRRLRICRAWSQAPLLRPMERRGHIAGAVQEYAAVADEMPPEEAYWLAYQATEFLDQVPRDHARLQDAQVLAFSAMRRSTDARWQLDAFMGLYWLCVRPGARRWCWSMLEELDAAQSRSAWIPLIIAESVYSNRYRDTGDLQRALEYAERADSLRTLRGNQPLAGNIDSTRLYTRLLQLIASGDTTQRSSIEAELLALRERDRWRDLASGWLFTLYQALGEQEQAFAAVDSWRTRETETLESLSLRFSALLSRSGGDLAPALELARDGLDRFGENETTLFLAALAHILAREGEWERLGLRFLNTEHEYRPYIAMMLYAALSEEKGGEDARQFLEAQWSRIDRDTWDERLQGGDANVWREMLIGYFLENVDPEDFFPVIEDPERYVRSGFRQLPLPRSMLLAEMYFYDALLQQVRRNHRAARARLEQVVHPEPSMLMETRRYYEYDLARHLLAVMAHDT